MALPDTYSLLYPGRFIKADLLKGQKVTLTIKSIDVEELLGENNKPAAKVIVAFVERPLEWVVPKTCGECLRRMWGNAPREWIGKRVTIYPTTTTFGRDTVDCIRIWGSPDIPEDLEITVPQGRKKALQVTLHKMVKNGNGSAPAKPPAVALDPRVAVAFQILGWTPAEQAAYLTDNANVSPAAMLAELNGAIDSRNQQEA